MIKKEDVVDYFFMLMGSISTVNFSIGRTSLLLAAIKEMEPEFSENSFEELLNEFDDGTKHGIAKFREKFLVNNK
ncbi:hypothetical protein [Psychromonas sp. SP041]|uniref:hypothetical protein n=1 Tax=Psychromonas sp. SP041 TaxID=1365007 RepID=UPI0004700C48|nr:hypothetical protein [Psychromonas sp. SP041]